LAVGGGLLVAVAVAVAAASAAVTSQTKTGSLAPGALAEITARINKYRAIPKFVAPGPRITNLAGAHGKSVFTMPASSQNPFCAAMDASGHAAAAKVGLKWTEWQNQGTSSSHVQGMSSAISRKVTAINLTCGLSPLQLGPQIDQAFAAHVPVVIGYAYDPSQPIAPHLAGRVDGLFGLPGTLMADWAMLRTKGDVDALVVEDLEFPPAKVQVDAIKKEFAKYCRGCKVKYVNVASNDWSTRIRPAVQAAVTGDHHLNYVLPIYDAMAQFVVPGIVSAGAVSRVKVATFNGTPAILDLVRTGDTIEMDVGESPGWIGYGIVDQDLRIATGLTPVRSEVVGVRVFDKSNVAEAGAPASLNKGYGASFVSGYAKLWGLKG
jgi:ribose transport system substrate-binding protein